MKGRYIIVFTIVILYLVSIAVFLVFFSPGESIPTTVATETSSPTSTANATLSPSPTPTAQKTACETDRDNIQTALDAYYNDHTGWPTADGVSGDIIWDELIPEYMSETPLIDSTCDWQVSTILEGRVCVAHTC